MVGGEMNDVDIKVSVAGLSDYLFNIPQRYVSTYKINQEWWVACERACYSLRLCSRMCAPCGVNDPNLSMFAKREDAIMAKASHGDLPRI
jgi:hypothetical protein